MNVVGVSSDGITGKCEEGVTTVKVESGGSERYLIELYEDCKPKALIVLAYPRRNSLAAALEALSTIPKGGLFFIKSQKDEEKVLAIAKRLERFINTKVALIGGKAPWLVSPGYDEEDFKDLLNTQVIKIDKNKLVETFDSIKEEEITDIVRSVKVGAFRINVKDEDLVKAAKLHLALAKLVSKFKAASINCFGVLKEVYVTPCLSLALFNAANFPFACEGDLNSLLTMILTYVAYGKVGGMFNLDYIENNEVLLAHCTVPLTLVDRFSLVPHYESGLPLAVEGEVGAGKESLVIRLQKNGAEVLRGKTTEGDRLNACRTQIWVELERSPRLLGNHRVWIDEGDKNLFIQVLRSLGIHKA